MFFYCLQCNQFLFHSMLFGLLDEQFFFGRCGNIFAGKVVPRVLPPRSKNWLVRLRCYI